MWPGDVWTASRGATRGGRSPYTYQWSVRWARSGLTSQLGTAASQSLYVCRLNGPGSFTMYVKVTSADGQTVTGWRAVFNGF